MIFRDNIYGACLEIDDTIIDSISSICLESYPNESGGFLVGRYSDDNCTAIVSSVIIPTSYSSTPVSYERDTNGMEPMWDQLYEDGLIYLGEWHSHPNGDASYSCKDKQALINIANSKSVKITSPIMLIFGFSKTTIKQIRAYYFKDGKIVDYE